MPLAPQTDEDVLSGLDFPTPCAACPRPAEVEVTCRRCGAGIVLCDPCLRNFIEHANAAHNGWAHCARCGNQGIFAQTFATNPIGGAR